MYRDRVQLRYRVVEVAFRGFSFEVNVDEGCFEGIRVYSGGWSIASGPCGKISELEKFARRSGSGGLRKATLFVGSWGSWSEENVTIDDIVRVVEECAHVMLEYGVTPEVILQRYCGERVIEHPEGRAVHRFCLYDVILAGVRGSLSVSDRLGFKSMAELRLLPRLAKSLAEKLTVASKRVVSLSPLEAGKWTVVLAGTAAGALYHELSHMLEGDYAARLPLGARIAPELLTVRDEPSNTMAVYNHVFDDEGVVATRKTLIMEGVVNEYLGTRWSREGRPGSARGLFHPPKAMHTVLIVSRGDWGERELVEETRRGILIETIHEARVNQDGVVTIVPELAWLVERGEVVAAVRLSRVRLRVHKELQTIDALGKVLWPRLSSEKGHWQVELAPSTRLQAYVD